VNVIAQNGCTAIGELQESPQIQSNETIIYCSVNSTTCLGLRGHHQVDQEYKTIYTALWKLRSQLLTVYNLSFRIALYSWCPLRPKHDVELTLQSTTFCLTGFAVIHVIQDTTGMNGHKNCVN
jgi:hypothetical protein